MRGREMRADELSTGMNVVIENCRSIDCASISIDPGKLNVKFAPNGTGNRVSRKPSSLLPVASTNPTLFLLNGSKGAVLKSILSSWTV